MRTYDTTFVIDGSITAEEREALIQRFADILERLGGKLDRIVRWGMRPLAYEINKRTRGYYVIFYHTSDPAIIKPFEHDLGLSEYILRYMTLIWDGVHPSYIHDEGQQVEAGELPPEIVEADESEEDVVAEADGEEVSEDTPEDDSVIEEADEEAGEADAAPEEDAVDADADTDEAPVDDDTDDAVKEEE